MSTSTLDPVSAAIAATLNVASFLALCPSGAMDDVPQNLSFPFLLYEVQEKPTPTLGTKAGSGGRILEVTIRLHVYSQQQGYTEAQQVMAEAIRLLAVALTVTGYASCGEPFHDETLPLGDQLVAGVKVKELAANLRVYLQE